MITEIVKNIKNEYSCDLCYYVCSKKQHYIQHLATRKHKMITENKNFVNLNLTCKCGKDYKYKSGLSKHKKMCNFKESVKISDDVSGNVILELIKNNQAILMENKEFKELLLEQNKQMMEFMNTKMVGNIINNTNSHNKFNLNLFLNEQCKDAMNISDFIKSLEISFEDFENVGTLGYAEGISNILINNLKKTEIEKRPMHCSDFKRETMYIKDKDMWENDKEKTIFISAIKGAAHQNFMKSMDWKKENPDYCDSASKTMDKYNKILYENCGPETKEEREKEYNKILRRVAREVTIDK